jgi:hypothetical protein
MNRMWTIVPVLAAGATLAAALATPVLASQGWPGWSAPALASQEATSDPSVPPGPATTLPDFIGKEVKARPLPSAGVPQDPYLGKNPYGYLHDDSWNSDTANGPGPLGHEPETISSTLGLPAVLQWASSTASFGFDSHGRLIAAFLQDGLVTGASVLLLDPVSLDVLFSYPFGTSAIGNIYFYVDDQDRVVMATGPRAISTLREGGTEVAPTLELVPERSYDLSQVIPEGDHLAGLLPDWDGNILFATAGEGAATGPRVGVIDPQTWPQVQWVELGKGEFMANGMAITRTDSYAITSEALYKLTIGSDGRPRVLWRAGYDHSVDKSQLGQLCVGSGTSPTIIGGGKYVTINDSAKQMHVLVFRTATKLKPGQRRLIGSTPVFADMAGQAAANSILGYRDSMVIQNSYGHSDAYDKDGFLRSTDSLPGLARIDIKPGGKGLRKVWVNDEVTSVSLPKLSTQTGLIYVIDRQDDSNGVDAYYWTAVDFRTGKVVWRKMAGRGVAWDSYFAPSSLGPTGTFYNGNYGGIAAVRDGE